MMDPQIGWHQPEQMQTDNFHIWDQVIKNSGFFSPVRCTPQAIQTGVGATLVPVGAGGLVVPATAITSMNPLVETSNAMNSLANKTSLHSKQDASNGELPRKSSTESLASSTDSDQDGKESDASNGSSTMAGHRSPSNTTLTHLNWMNGINLTSPTFPNIELNGHIPHHPSMVPDTPRTLTAGSWTNIASTYNMDSNRHLIKDFKGTPWRKGLQYNEGSQGLHEEIVDFHCYMRPTPEEAAIRNLVVQSIKDVITHRYPDAIVDVFGSFRTTLYLPTSDIDMVVFGQWDEFPLWTLTRCLVTAGICESDEVKVLDKATVPIIKITCKIAKIRVDISFNTTNGVKSADLINQYKRQYPEMEPLVLVLKQFLLQRDLNEVFTGGISSYSLILMVVSFIQHMSNRNEYREHRLRENYGNLLIQFFELYGHMFNYWQLAIRVRDGENFVPKSEIQRNMDPTYRPNFLCIEDPLNPRNDIGKSSYGAVNVKRAFEYAYNTLNATCGPNSVAMNKRYSTLSRIVLVTDDVVRYRQWVQTEVYQAVHPMLTRRNLLPVPITSPPPLPISSHFVSHNSVIPKNDVNLPHRIRDNSLEEGPINSRNVNSKMYPPPQTTSQPLQAVSRNISNRGDAVQRHQQNHQGSHMNNQKHFN